MSPGLRVRLLLLWLLFAGQFAAALGYRRAGPRGHGPYFKLDWTSPRRDQPVLLRPGFNSAQPSFPVDSSEAVGYGGGSRTESWVRGYKTGLARGNQDLWGFVLPQAQKENMYPLGVVSSNAIRMTSGLQSEAKPPPSAEPQQPSFPALNPARPQYPSPLQWPTSSDSQDDEQTYRFHKGIASSPRIIMHSGPKPEPRVQQQNFLAQTQSKAGRWHVPQDAAFGSVLQFPDFLLRLHGPEAVGYRSG